MSLSANTSYTYQVAAVNSEGLEGTPSDPVSATTLPVPAVVGLSADGGPGSMLLTWTAPDDYAGLNYNYEIYFRKFIIIDV